MTFFKKDVILYVYRDWWVKGWNFFKEIMSEITGFRVIIVIPAGVKAIDEKELVFLKGNEVEIVEKPTRDQLIKLYQRAEIVMNVSYTENQPLFLIEGMACGCIPVGWNCGGTSELYGPEQGVMVNFGDVEQLVAVLKNWGRVSDKQVLRENCVRRARDFDYYSVAKQYEDIFAGIGELNGQQLGSLAEKPEEIGKEKKKKLFCHTAEEITKHVDQLCEKRQQEKEEAKKVLDQFKGSVEKAAEKLKNTTEKALGVVKTKNPIKDRDKFLIKRKILYFTNEGKSMLAIAEFLDTTDYNGLQELLEEMSDEGDIVRFGANLQNINPDLNAKMPETEQELLEEIPFEDLPAEKKLELIRAGKI